MGDKSDPSLIKEMFPGMSKKQFKDAVGGLYRDGMIIPSRDSIELIPEEEQAAVRAKMAEAREARQRQMAANDGAGNDGREAKSTNAQPNKRVSASVAKRQERDARTLYCGNLSYSLTEALLIEEFETVCGNGAVNSVRFSERRDCAWVELRDESMAEKAVGPMHDLEVLGRQMNVDRTGHLSKKAKGRA